MERSTGELDALTASFGRSLRARNRSPKTISAYIDTARFAAFCGRGYDQRRDTAIVRLFIDTGARIGEVAGIRVDDVDLDGGGVLVWGKGSRSRTLALGAKSVLALDRYLRERRRHPHAGAEWCWLGPKGRLTDNGDRITFGRPPDGRPNAPARSCGAGWPWGRRVAVPCRPLEVVDAVDVADH